MSYAIHLEKDERGVTIREVSGLAYIPNSGLIISGHVPAPGMSKVWNLGVSLWTLKPDLPSDLVAQVMTSYTFPDNG